MTTTIATLTYAIGNRGVLTDAQLAALFNAAAVPLPSEYLASIGASVVNSDTTAAGGIGVQRVVSLALVPTVAASTINATIDGNGTIVALGQNVFTTGQGYSAPPIVSFTPPAGTLPGIPAQATAYLRAHAITGSLGGTGYTNPTLTPIGGTGPNYVAPVFAFTLNGSGAITGVSITSKGSQMVSNLWQLSDPTGSGARVFVTMELDPALVLVQGGKGYLAAPTVVLTPRFKYLFPDTAPLSSQTAALQNLLTTAIAQATSGVVPVATVALS